MVNPVDPADWTSSVRLSPRKIIMKRFHPLGLTLVLELALGLSLGTARVNADPQPKSDSASGQSKVAFEPQPDGLLIRVGGEPFASYHFEDGPTTRPFFTDLRAPGGIPITRNHPPKPGVDPADHATMHPGLWLAFGDINGADFWRNKNRIRHAGFIDQPKGEAGRGEFAVRNRYEKGGQTIGEEVARFTILPRPEGVLLIWDSTFRPEGKALVFGDQEEMGLGVRLATPLTVKHGKGRIVNSDGLENERQLWGKPANWCAADGPVGETENRAGVLLMTHPDNFRASRFHARDYGLLVSNPFGIHAFTGGQKSALRFEPGQTLRLRHGVYVFRGKPDFKDTYADYLKAARP
jgi:hypothetical protein